MKTIKAGNWNSSMKTIQEGNWKILCSSSLDRGTRYWYVKVWNDKFDRETFFFKCKNEASAKMMMEALRINYSK